MSASVISYEILDRFAGEEGFLWQYDYGQRMRLHGIVLPNAYTVHFANSSNGASVLSIGNAEGVAIPDQVLQSGKPVYFWLFLHAGNGNGQTVYGNVIKIRQRANLPTGEQPTPAQQSAIEELIAALDAGVQHVDDVIENIPNIVDDEIDAAKERGEFKGDPGTVFTPSIVNGVIIWSNDGGLPDPPPTDLVEGLGLRNFATKQDLSTKVDNGKIGQQNGVASLDETGRVPSSQLPSYVDDVLEFPSLSMFPSHGESGKIYISLSNNHQYRWTGTQYIDMTSTDISTKADKHDTVLESTLSRGRKASTAVGTGSIAFGDNVTASGDFSRAVGEGTEATGDGASAEGHFSKAEGDGAHAENTLTKAAGADSHAEGYSTDAEGDTSHAEGGYTVAEGDSSHAEGCFSEALSFASHAEGEHTTATGGGAHSEGEFTIANGAGSHAEGYGGTFTLNGEEYDSGAYGTGAHSEGYKTCANYPGAHSEGINTVADANQAHAEGAGTMAAGEHSHAEGVGTHANGANSHAEGSSTVASGAASHAEGNGAQANGVNAHAEGAGSSASGACAHAEGSGTTASGNNSHSEGSGTQAIGDQSHAEGGGSQAVGNYSHAEGGGAYAVGAYAHAEGGGTRAAGDLSHAEGGGTQANGAGSHAEGGGTQANGANSHAEGSGSVASGADSHAEGAYTHATGAQSHVFGCLNVEDSYDNTRWPEWAQGEHCVPGDRRKRTRIIDEETVVQGFVCIVDNSDANWDDSHWEDQNGRMNYVEVVGNGYGNTRSNAYSLDWDGNGHFAGDVYVGCNPDGTGGTKLEFVAFATDAETMSIFENA